MDTVSMFEAKTNLSKYVASVETGKEPYIIILRNGKPAAKLVPCRPSVQNRIGVAKDVLPLMPSLEDFNSISVADLFDTNEGLL